MDDPYVYPGTHILKNKANLRTQRGFERFERLATQQRLEEGVPDVLLTVDGYRSLHRHLFQDIFDWAGEYQTVEIAKGNSMFCRAVFVEREMTKRFAAIAGENWRGMNDDEFAARAAEHVAELNAIHPYREGNGRTMRAFLEVAGRRAGCNVRIEDIDPRNWLEASQASFASGDVHLMKREILRITEDLRK